MENTQFQNINIDTNRYIILVFYGFPQISTKYLWSDVTKECLKECGWNVNYIYTLKTFETKLKQ